MNKIENVLNNLSSIEQVKIEDCEVYNEYSVIVLYNNGKSDIITCESSKEVNEIYNFINSKLEEYIKSTEDKSL